MSKLDKLIQKIFCGNANITPNEAIKILEMLNFRSAPTGGSHLTFRKLGCASITIVITQNPLKPYIVKKLQDALIDEGYQNG